MKNTNIQYLNRLNNELKNFEKTLKIPKKSEMPELLARDIQEKALNILANISDIIAKKYPNLEGKQREDFAVNVLQRFSHQHTLKQKEIQEIPTIENLLDTISQTVTEILENNSAIISDIYRKNSKQKIGVGTNNREFENSLQSEPKFEKIMKILQEHYNISDINITTEKLNENRTRRIPYRIIHILDKENPITITVSDEIGQATYIFHGYIPLADFINAEKGEAINNITPIKLKYSDKFSENFAKILQNPEIKTKQDSSENFSEKNLTPEIIRYQADILEIIPELKKIGLIEINGKYYFENMKSDWTNILISGKKLQSFPNAKFLRKKGIISEDKLMMNNSSQIIHFFQVLGFNIANEEDYLKLYKSQILEIIPELKKIGLEEIDGKYYFENLRSSVQWPNIAGRTLANFPNIEFLREKGIIKKGAAITKTSQIAYLFGVLGFDIANEKDYLELYKNHISEIIPELEKIGLEKIDGKYYFENLTQDWKRIIISGRYLQSFPNIKFLLEKRIIEKGDKMTTPSQLAHLFGVLGFEIANEKDYLRLYKNQIIEIIPELKKIGLEEINGKYYFEKSQGSSKWPKINGKNLKSFPNIKFLLEKRIIEKNRTDLSNSLQLAHLFQVLGFDVEIPNKK